MRRTWIAAVLLAAPSAFAQPAEPTPAPPVEAPPPAPPADEPPPAEADAEEEPELDPAEMQAEMTARIEALENKLKLAEESKKSKFPIKLSGYGDVGFFAAQGDGTGIRQDFGHTMFPNHDNYAWVFYGDLLATAVNSRGDVADLGDLPAVPDRYDTINSGGNPSFLVNELNMTVNAGLGERALFTSSMNFTPRSGSEFRFGDTFDADIVQLEYMPTDDGKTSLFVGKVDSVIGIEYKTRKANSRFGITPSLLARYTTGTAVGLKARTKLADDKIILAAAVTNSSFGTEQFHFYREIDDNAFKTLSGRAAVRLPVLGGTFEAGPSGQFGRQDGAPSGNIWFVGVDAQLELPRVDIKLQWLRGKAPGYAPTNTYSLDLRNGGYLEADVLVTPVIGLLGRAEFRDAEVAQGMDRLYITKNWRATVGARFIFNPHAVLKAEFLHNGTYGDVPSIPDDVFTTSAVMAF